MTNRGRFQAQDNYLEKSAAWATNAVVSKQIGNQKLDNLQGQLTNAELDVRLQSMQKARDFVNNAPIQGYSAQIIKSYYDDVQNRSVRVDVEIRAGTAFQTINP